MLWLSLGYVFRIFGGVLIRGTKIKSILFTKPRLSISSDFDREQQKSQKLVGGK